VYVVLWRFRPLRDRESEFERAYSSTARATSAPNYSSAPTIPEST
jgi:hypothetical protein